MDVLEIKGTECFLVRKRQLNRNYYLNGEMLYDKLINDKVVINKNDNFQYKKDKVLIDYRNGEKVISIEEYNSKPQYYDDENTDEEVLRAIANKKELEGFRPNYNENVFENVDINIVGSIENTESYFIECNIQSIYKKDPVVYTVNGGKIAMDEYMILSKKYSSQAKFGKPDRNYLRFVKINNNYAFSDTKPFGDWAYRDNFTNLKLAKDCEKQIRESVRRVVKKHLFKEKLTEYKAVQLLGQINLVKKSTSIENMVQQLDLISNDLEKYVNSIKN